MVAVVGRPNVGKSTMLNRLIGRQEAIVHEEEGITRDRLYIRADWNGRDFLLVDTGGIVPGTHDELLKTVAQQAQLAIAEADVVLLMVDARSGITATDRDIAGILRKSGKSVMLAANKCDSIRDDPQALEFYELGLGDPMPVSAQHGTGTGDLLDAIVAALPCSELPEEEPEAVRIAIIGRPNVGKSSLVNHLLGQERMIVSSAAGTTRDAIDCYMQVGDQPVVLVDTAGIRRKAKVPYGVEQFAVVRALKAIDKANVIVLILDALDGVTDQDKRLAGIARESGKAMVLVVNKWDCVNKDTYTLPKYRQEVLQSLY
ncbi:MAG: ribosome biogenesis GTPase Der, partial [Cyanobacteria bacterium NC_groundwater_1444_Ag_S-0.65um_54_12]|nr:ribosome biogenesis GTPase Der [Cyanobacteria bacterium NC_groundwater_1444_Ag_S-0.65um_54_12]